MATRPSWACDITCNLVAHDGKFRQWRTWANEVVPPFRTTPGQVIEGVEIVRPGESFVQVAPFWLDAGHAPEGTSRTVTVEAGKTISGVELKAAPAR